MGDSVGILIKKVIHGEDAGIRRKALIELGYEKSPDIYPLLIEQLDDPNSSIQHAAVISLGRYGNPLAIAGGQPSMGYGGGSWKAGRLSRD